MKFCTAAAISFTVTESVNHLALLFLNLIHSAPSCCRQLTCTFPNKYSIIYCALLPFSLFTLHFLSIVQMRSGLTEHVTWFDSHCCLAKISHGIVLCSKPTQLCVHSTQTHPRWLSDFYYVFFSQSINQ